MLEGGYAAVQADEDVVGTSRVRKLENPRDVFPAKGPVLGSSALIP